VEYRTLDDLNRLAEDDRAALLGLAGLGLPTSNSHLARVMAGTRGFPQAQAWAANPRLLQERLLRLQGLGLAETTRQGYWVCAEPALESAARMAFAQGVLGRLHQGAVTGTGHGAVLPEARMRCRAELRLAFLEGSHQRWLPLRQRFEQQFGDTIRHRDPLGLICGGPFEPVWFETLDPAAQAYGCQALLLDQALHGLRSRAFLDWMEIQAATPRATPSALPLMLFLILQGRSAELGAWKAAQPAGTRNGYAWPALEALEALAAGQPARAADRFGQSLARLEQASGRRAALLPGLYEPFHILALLALRDPRARERTLLLARRDPQDPMPAALHRLGQSLAGIPLPPPKPRVTPNTVLNLFMEALGAYLGGEPLAPEQPDRLLRACAPLPLGWFAKELLELRNRLQGQPARPSPLLDLVPQQAPWERALASLRRLGQDRPPAPMEKPGKH
jgi:hypothetical protein